MELRRRKMMVTVQGMGEFLVFVIRLNDLKEVENWLTCDEGDGDFGLLW